MLSAYYGKQDTASLFENLKIAKAELYKERLNQYAKIFERNEQCGRDARNAEEVYFV